MALALVGYLTGRSVRRHHRHRPLKRQDRHRQGILTPLCLPWRLPLLSRRSGPPDPTSMPVGRAQAGSVRPGALLVGAALVEVPGPEVMPVALLVEVPGPEVLQMGAALILPEWVVLVAGRRSVSRAFRFGLLIQGPDTRSCARSVPNAPGRPLRDAIRP